MSLEARLRAILAGDAERLHLLRLVARLGLPDGWIGAGFVRNAVWDCLHGQASPVARDDIDVVWFDPVDTAAETDRHIEEHLAATAPGYAWSVKNQARMHERNGDAPYASTADALRHWPETATVVAARCRDMSEDLALLAPHGLEDLFALILRPTPHFAAREAVILQRAVNKGWRQRWPSLIYPV